MCWSHKRCKGCDLWSDLALHLPIELIELAP